MKKLGLVLIALTLITFSCKKEEEDLIHATIIDGGAAALDGCGWLLEANNVTYSPINLDSAFMMDNLEVLVLFDITGDSSTCGIGANIHYPLISISEIKNH